MNKQPIITNIKKYFQGNETIAAVYLFGSMIREGGGLVEDVDIAVLFRHTRVPDFFTFVNLREDLSDLVSMEVDLVAMNTASPVINMQVLRKGELIIDADPHIRQCFHMRTISEYYDFRRIRKPVEDKISQQTILHG